MGDSPGLAGILGFLGESSTYRHIDQIADSLGQLTAHGQVLHQLGSVLTFLLGGLEEVLGESRAVDGVAGEVGAHGQVLVGGVDLLLDLIAHALYAGILHVHPVLGNLRNSQGACNGIRLG